MEKVCRLRLSGKTLTAWAHCDSDIKTARRHNVYKHQNCDSFYVCTLSLVIYPWWENKPFKYRIHQSEFPLLIPISHCLKPLTCSYWFWLKVSFFYQLRTAAQSMASTLPSPRSGRTFQLGIVWCHPMQSHWRATLLMLPNVCMRGRSYWRELTFDLSLLYDS